MLTMRRPSTVARVVLLSGLAALFTCEFLVYYVTLFSCSYPSGSSLSDSSGSVKAMILADTHLLGSRNGHWFDKLRREWQMHRAFQTAITYFRPEVVFFLGDLFDEGKWCPPEEFEYYVQRFSSLFRVDPAATRVAVMAGNHDIGFHYATSPYLDNRFRSAFNTTAVHTINMKGTSFVMLNSVAFEGDSCFLCEPAERELKEVGSNLACPPNKPCPRPVLLSHYPLFRRSDADCNEPDAAPAEEKGTRFREKWDCISQNSTRLIVNTLRPRLAFSGHTHHGCRTQHREFLEWTVASFSWRNKVNPSFLLAEFGPTSDSVAKCYMPEEGNVYLLYLLFAAVPVLSLVKLRR